MITAISVLRQRMIDDLRQRNLSPETQDAYVRAVKNFSRHFSRSPDHLSHDDVRTYLLHLTSRGRTVTETSFLCEISKWLNEATSATIT